MATITKPRRRGQRENISHAETTREGAVHHANGAGNWEIEEAGNPVPREPSRKSKSVSWAELVEAVSNADGIVATAWHPDPMGSVIGTNCSDVRVLTGEVGYQLSSGEIVRL